MNLLLNGVLMPPRAETIASDALDQSARQHPSVTTPPCRRTAYGCHVRGAEDSPLLSGASRARFSSHSGFES
jgi:hypothetical protein